MQTMHLSRQSDKMRSIADYIFIAGLHDDPKLRTRESCLVDPPLPPITEIGILNKAEQDTPPHGFSIIDRSINGHQANLNYNTSKSPLFLCVKRGWDMPPLIDIGVLYEHKEKIMEECKQITETFSGSCANVSNSTKNKIFLTYRRAPPTDCVDILSVYDICVILPDKNEKTPPSYMRIEKSLNKSLLSSGSFICYKKSVCKQYTLSYKPEVLDVFPKCEIVESEAYFCLPKGGLLEVWPSTNSSDPRSVFSTFVLTSSSGVNTYGAVLSFYEPFSYDKLTDSESSELSANPNSRIKVSKAICIVSKWPFFDEFHKFLQHVYRQKNIERHISHFLFEIPFPSVQRPRIQIEFGMETVIFTQPDELPIPICGGRYVQLLKTLGPEFAVQLLYYILLEHKIVLHSLRSHILTNIAETCRSIIFPFNWSFPYIPLCPLNLLDVTESPSAIIVGWDSCFVSRSNLPRDATCIDLDTQKISVAEHRKDVQYKSMPKKATKELKNTLTKKLTEISNYINSDNNAFDAAYKMKEKQIEVSIQEAFLRFMVCLLSGYSEYLIPITTGPCMSSTDVSDRFDVAGFLKSRDRSSRTFYEQLMNTQCFAHFIQERSFVSDKDTCYVFFDECIERVKDEHANLLECENRLQDTTSIITPVECEYVASMKDYVFPSAFDHSLFNSNNGQEVTSSRAQSEEQLSTPSYPVACRRKHEVKSALKLANESKNVKDKPHLWAQFLLSNCYSLWFTHLPYYVSSLPENERDACLRMAFNYLVDMQSANLAQPDELCYRVLMHLCKADMADLSLKILYEMKLSKVKPNAITYGYYNKSVLESSSKGLTNHVVKRWRSAIYRQIIVNVFISITKYKVNDEFLSLRKQLDETRISPGCSSDEEEKSLDKKDILPCESMQSNIDKSSDMSDRGYDSLSRDDAKSMVEQYTDQAPSKRLFASEIKETNEDMLVCEDSILVDICSDTSSSKLASTTTATTSATACTITSHLPCSPPSHPALSKSAVDLLSPSLTDDSALGDCTPFTSDLSDSPSLVDAPRPLNPTSTPDLLAPQPAPPIHSSLCSAAPDLIHVATPPLPSMLGSDVVDAFLALSPNPSADAAHTSISSAVPLTPMIPEITAQTKPCSSSSPPGPHQPSTTSTAATSEPDVSKGSTPASTCLLTCTSDQDGLDAILGDITDTTTTTTINSTNTTTCCPHKPSKTYPGFSEQLVSAHVTILTPIPASDPVTTNSITTNPTNTTPTTATHNSMDDNPVDDTFAALDRQADQFNALRHSCSLDGNELLTSQSEGDNNYPSSSDNVDTDTFSKPRLSATLPANTLPMPNQSNNNKFGMLKSAASAFASKFTTIKQSMTTNAPSGSSMSLASSIGGLSTTSSTIADTPSTPGGEGKRSAYFGDLASVAWQSVKRSIQDNAGNWITYDLEYPGEEELSRRRQRAIDTKTPASTSTHPSTPSSTASRQGEQASQHSADEEFVDYDSIDDNEVSHPDGMIPGRLALSDCMTALDRCPANLALDVQITTLNRCQSCQSFLYDEQIMAGWTADDYNHNTTCIYCNKNVLPSMKIYIKDYRYSKRPLHRDTTSDTSATTTDCTPDTCTIASPSSSPSHKEATSSSTTTSACPTATATTTYNISSDKSHSPKTPSKLDMGEPVMTSTVKITRVEHDNSDVVYDDHKESVNTTIDHNETIQNPHDSADDLEPHNVDPIKVNYLSPIVLRKSMENILFAENNFNILASSFVDEHPILFWNLIWYYHRISARTYLPRLLFKSNLLSTPGKTCHSSWSTASERNVFIQAMWDDANLHDDMGKPMYIMWAEQITSLKPISPNKNSQIVTNSNGLPFELMKPIISFIMEQSNTYKPINLILEVRARRSYTQRVNQGLAHPIYREIMFLSFVALKRENIDIVAFDSEYQRAFKRISAREERRLHKHDSPLQMSAAACRGQFKELLLIAE